MPLFTIGPVEMFPDTLEVRSRQVPYFRNAAFSQVVFESCDMLQQLMGAEEGARTILLTSSGTGAMEATVWIYDEANGIDRPIGPIDLTRYSGPQAFERGLQALMARARFVLTADWN